MEVILEFLEGLKSVYSAESYDLFHHNCNNFSNDFAMFLVGKGIPEHITSLPDTFLNTPFGQMIKPQLDQSMRGITQAPTANPISPRANGSVPQLNGLHSLASKGSSNVNTPKGTVKNVTSLKVLEGLLSQAAKSGCAVIFFTSATCPPCKMAYPAYDSLAEEFPKATLIKVDISIAREIAAKYQIRVTPTFMTFIRGEKENEWTGASPATLLGNVRLLVQMAFPLHKHLQMNLPNLQRPHRPIRFEKVPPLDKLANRMAKVASKPAVSGLLEFVKSRQSGPHSVTPLPDMAMLTTDLPRILQSVKRGERFPIIDLLRCAVLDVRMSEYLVLKAPSLLEAVISESRPVDNEDATPEDQTIHKTRITALQCMANLFANLQVASHMLNNETLVENASGNILDVDRPQIREAAAMVLHNIAVTDCNNRVRSDETDDDTIAQLNADLKSRIVAAVVEAMKSEESIDAIRAELLTVGLLLYRAPSSEELDDLLVAVEAKKEIENLKIVGGKQDLRAVRNELCMILP